MQFTSEQNDQDWRSRIDKRFTSLRGFAALTVMLAHYQYIGLLPASRSSSIPGNSALCCSSFFRRSCFVILSHRIPIGRARPHLSLIAYAINRIFRIFPLLVLVIALTYWNRSSFFDPSVAYWEALRLSVTLGKAPSVLWTIPVELTFYLYLPIVLALALPAARSRFGAAALALAFLAWCAAIAFARHNGVSASPWMTLGFHHYANSFVGGVLLYALLANDRIPFPRSAAWVARVAPLMFILAYPFLYFAIFRRDFSMGGDGGAGRLAILLRLGFPRRAARRRRRGLRPSSPLGISIVPRHANWPFAQSRRFELRRLPRPHSDDRFARVHEWPMAVLRRHRRDFCRGGRAVGIG